MVEYKYAHVYSFTVGLVITQITSMVSGFGFKVDYPVLLVDGIGSLKAVNDFVDSTKIRAVNVPEFYDMSLSSLARYLEVACDKFDKDLEILSFVVVSTYYVVIVDVSDRDRLVRHLSRLVLTDAG